MTQAATSLTTPEAPDPSIAWAQRLRRKSRPAEAVIQGLLFLSGAISILTTVGIVFVLGNESLSFFLDPEVSIVEFLTGLKWQPQIGEFGVWPLVNATMMTSLIAMVVAMPLGLFAAVYLSEYASPRTKAILKPTLEVLAGIPTVVFGFFALTFITPILRGIFGQDTVQIYNDASAGLVMGLMIVPLIASMSEDALSAVPRALREGAYGLGATKFEVAMQVVVPAAFSGLVAAFIIGVSRAVGETMIVAIAAGATSQLTFNPFQAAETITGHIARISGGDLSYGSLDYRSLFALALTLFIMTLGLNLVSRWMVNRYREQYD